MHPLHGESYVMQAYAYGWSFGFSTAFLDRIPGTDRLRTACLNAMLKGSDRRDAESTESAVSRLESILASL